MHFQQFIFFVNWKITSWAIFLLCHWNFRAFMREKLWINRVRKCLEFPFNQRKVVMYVFGIFVAMRMKYSALSPPGFWDSSCLMSVNIIEQNQFSACTSHFVLIYIWRPELHFWLFASLMHKSTLIENLRIGWYFTSCCHLSLRLSLLVVVIIDGKSLSLLLSGVLLGSGDTCSLFQGTVSI